MKKSIYVGLLSFNILFITTCNTNSNIQEKSLSKSNCTYEIESYAKWTNSNGSTHETKNEQGYHNIVTIGYVIHEDEPCTFINFGYYINNDPPENFQVVLKGHVSPGTYDLSDIKSILHLLGGTGNVVSDFGHFSITIDKLEKPTEFAGNISFAQSTGTFSGSYADILNENQIVAFNGEFCIDVQDK